MESPHTGAVRRAVEDVAQAEAALDAARARRDQVIVAMHYEDGVRAPDIARTTGMSVSNVRLVLSLHKPRA